MKIPSTNLGSLQKELMDYAQFAPSACLGYSVELQIDCAANHQLISLIAPQNRMQL